MNRSQDLSIFIATEVSLSVVEPAEAVPTDATQHRLSLADLAPEVGQQNGNLAQNRSDITGESGPRCPSAVPAVKLERSIRSINRR